MTIKSRVLALALASFALLAAGQMPTEMQIDADSFAATPFSADDADTALTAADLAAIDARTAQLRAAAVPLDAGTQDALAPEPAIRIQDFVRLSTLVAGADAVEMNDEMKCLATAVYFEARGEPLEGQLAVAQVIRNRVESGRYASSVCGVVYQPGQFTFARNRAPAATSQDWKVAQAIALIAMTDGYREVAPDALSFHAVRVSPNWGGKRKVSQIGNHIFYR
ncbi:MAG: cell wall hydrolase [Polymorphobacter sp.]